MKTDKPAPPRRVELAQAIMRDVDSSWIKLTSEQRAALVVSWCGAHDVHVLVSANKIARAMEQMPSYAQGPANYLDMVFAANALISTEK